MYTKLLSPPPRVYKAITPTPSPPNLTRVDPTLTSWGGGGVEGLGGGDLHDWRIIGGN